MDSISDVFGLVGPLALIFGWWAYEGTKKNNQRLDAIETRLKELTDTTPPADEPATDE